MARQLRFFTLLILASAASAGIWPEQFGPAKRLSVKPLTVTDQKLWAEYGLQETEQAEFEGGAGDSPAQTQKFTAKAYRLQDSTAALGAYYWQRPKDAKQSQLGKLAAETPVETILAHGNYLLVFQGYKPSVEQIGALIQTLPNLDQAPLPSLKDYLPVENLQPNSERYVVGPVGLEAFDSSVPAGVAAFHLGSEAQIGTYNSGKGELKLAIFSYPTPNLARERLADMQKLPGAIAKRTGPLVALILPPANADDAERVLSQIRYHPAISWSQYIPSRRDNIGDLVVNAFILIGVLLAFSTVAGVAYGGIRALSRRSQKENPDAMTVLHLGDR